MATQTAKETPKVESKWKKVNSNFMKLENPGDSIEGKLVKKDALYFAGQELPTGRYTFAVETSDGPVNKTILGTVGLDEMLSEIEIGTLVKVTFDGVEKTKGKRDFRRYTVEYQ